MKDIFIICGPGSSVGIATDYRLDGPGSNHVTLVSLDRRICLMPLKSNRLNMYEIILNIIEM